MSAIDYLAHIEADGRALLAALHEDPAADVASCPGWDVSALATHLGGIYALASGLVRTRAPEFVAPGPEAVPPAADPAEVADWFEERLADLLDVLGSVDPDEPVWTWTPQQRAGFYHRRMAMETAVHRWDAQAAVGEPRPIDRALAVDGVDEILAVGLRYSLSRPDRVYPEKSLHLHCTDGEGEWLVRLDDGDLVVTHEHAKGDAAVRGRASDLFLFLWGRGSDGLDIIGDGATALEWAALAP